MAINGQKIIRGASAFGKALLITIPLWIAGSHALRGQEPMTEGPRDPPIPGKAQIPACDAYGGEWKIQGWKASFEVALPAGMTGQLYNPAREQSSGEMNLTCSLTAAVNACGCESIKEDFSGSNKIRYSVSLLPSDSNYLVFKVFDLQGHKEWDISTACQRDTVVQPSSMMVTGGKTKAYLETAGDLKEAERVAWLVDEINRLIPDEYAIIGIMLAGPKRVGRCDPYSRYENGQRAIISRVSELGKESTNMRFTRLAAKAYYEYVSTFGRTPADDTCLTRLSRTYERAIRSGGTDRGTADYPFFRLFTEADYMSKPGEIYQYPFHDVRQLFASGTAILRQAPEAFFKKLGQLEKKDPAQAQWARTAATDIVMLYHGGLPFSPLVYQELGLPQ